MSVYENFIYKRTYARWLENEKRRENWEESVDRYKNFFIDRVPDEQKKEFLNCIESIKNKEIMPSMRALYTAGKALERENIAGYNCSYITINTIKSFAELLYVLLCGCFEKNTLIKTKNGDKKISELTSNDEILTYNIKDNKFEYEFPLFVIETPGTAKKPKIELEFDDGSIIKCTEDHEFYTTNRGWVKAKDLIDEDDIKNFFEK